MRLRRIADGITAASSRAQCQENLEELSIGLIGKPEQKGKNL